MPYPHSGVAMRADCDRPTGWPTVAGMRLSPSDAAADFTLEDADSKPHSLADFRGSRLVVYFYPAAMTPGCTKQACDFRDNLGLLSDAGVAVVGISPDSPAKLAKFRDKESLSFPLLSDPDHEVLAAYGAWGEKTLYGKKVTGVIRSTVVIDADGRVEQAFYNVKATGHVAKLLRDLKLSDA
jgi:peroxiredoxin Q/BCP